MLFQNWFLSFVIALVVWTGYSTGIYPPAKPLRRNPVVDAVARSRPGIVMLKVAKSDGYGGSREATGTGVIVDERGYLVTTRHTIAGASRIHIVLADGTEFSGRVLAADKTNDLAILQFQPRGLVHSLSLGQGNDVLVGETVIAVGHPYGYAYTVSAGIISALGREIRMPSGESLTDLIQVDANINPGNSGGPLLNIRGEWIGLLVAVRDGAQGIAFALNADTIKAMLLRHLGKEIGTGPHCGRTHSERTFPESSP